MRIYTLGTSNREYGEFIALLNKFHINCVIDIRRFPTSKLEHFQKNNLEKLLLQEKIKYIYLGKELGGYRKGGYKSYMKTEEFKRGIEAILKIAEEKITALLCAEKFAWKCHRRYVAQALKERGCEVIHIINKTKIWKF